MPPAPLPSELESFLAGPRPCVMATVRDDGSPATVACWYEYDGGNVLLSMGRDARRLEHLRHNPHAALTILGDNWYQHVSLLGHVTEIRQDPALVDLDRLSVRYLGIPYTEREAGVTVVVTVERWHTFGEPGAAEAGA